MNGDKQPIIIKCMKNGKKFRTYVYIGSAVQHFGTVKRCYAIFAEIKKGLGTSMEVKSASENNDDKNVDKNVDKNTAKIAGNNISEESSDEHNSDSPVETTTVKKEKLGKPDKQDKKKKKKIRKTINYVDDPVFSFGGDQINKIIKILTTNAYVSSDMIKV